MLIYSIKIQLSFKKACQFEIRSHFLPAVTCTVTRVHTQQVCSNMQPTIHEKVISIFLCLLFASKSNPLFVFIHNKVWSCTSCPRTSCCTTDLKSVGHALRKHVLTISSYTVHFVAVMWLHSCRAAGF